MSSETLRAEACITSADDWANRDNVDADFRARMVDYNLRLAAIHAQLAVAERLGGIEDQLRELYAAGAAGWTS